jgi:hypothetical protein
MAAGCADEEAAQTANGGAAGDSTLASSENTAYKQFDTHAFFQGGGEADLGDYLVVGNRLMVGALGSLLEARAAQGYRVGVGDLTAINNSYEGEHLNDKVRSFLQDAVDPSRETLVLLVGSNVTIPMAHFQMDQSGASYVFTDFFYANLHSDFDSNGDGQLAEYGVDDYDLNIDVHVARVPIDDPAKLADWAAKTLWFEANGGAYSRNTLLAAGYISIEGDSAIGQEMVKDLVLRPAGYDVMAMYEALDPENPPPALPQGYKLLTETSMISEVRANDYGLVFWMSHGNTYGAYLLNGGAFIDFNDADAVAALPPAIYFSSACDNSYPRSKSGEDNEGSIGEALVGAPAVAFVGSTTETWPGVIYEGILVLMSGVDRVVVQRLPLAVAIDGAKEYYRDLFWEKPYEDQIWFLMNYFGFTPYGDPATQYPAFDAE